MAMWENLSYNLCITYAKNELTMFFSENIREQELLTFRNFNAAKNRIDAF